MIRGLVLLAFVSLLLFSCKNNSKSQQIIGTWRAVKLENPDMDSFFIKSQQYIDTIGKNNDAATNMQLYGVTNMDSMRAVLQSQYDSAKAIQLNAVANTVFTFRKDSVAVLLFNGNTDSSKWYFENNKLVLNELSGAGGSTDKVSMDVMELSETALKLKFVENNSYSIVTFHLEGK